MAPFAYVFERFPAFSQTFCYREVAELERQGVRPPIFSIRKPQDEPVQDWDERIIARVHYLPDEEELADEVRRAIKGNKLSSGAIAAIEEWDKRTDFLRLYQAVHVGLRLRDLEIRHVHAHFAGLAARTAFWIARFFDIGFSFTAHANDIFAPRQFEIGLDRLVDLARAVVTVTDYGANFLKERFPGRAERICRIYNGVDLKQFERAHFSGGPPLLVAIGRLIEKKGFGDLVRACRALKEQGTPFRCEIIGEGPLAEALSHEIEQLGLGRDVKLLGAKPQREIGQHLAEAILFVLSSVQDPSGGMDNLPTVIMEAMATGLPVVSTPIGGIPEMVVENETGLLVGPGDSDALAAALKTLIVDPALARRLGEAGRKRARDLFSIEKNVQDLLRLIEQVAKDQIRNPKLEYRNKFKI
ncbi:MAG TPA: glycosyltransferase family 4 protein [Chthoniobacterales bacterium]